MRTAELIEMLKKEQPNIYHNIESLRTWLNGNCERAVALAEIRGFLCGITLAKVITERQRQMLFCYITVAPSREEN